MENNYKCKNVKTIERYIYIENTRRKIFLLHHAYYTNIYKKSLTHRKSHGVYLVCPKIFSKDILLSFLL